MLKILFRNIAIYATSLFLVPYFVSGVKIYGGIQTIIIGAIVLTGMFLLLRPILQVLTFPFNIITMGLFSIVTNAVILYLLTVFVPNIQIQAYRFPGASIGGFSISPFGINTFFAFLVASVVLSIISGGIKWLVK